MDSRAEFIKAARRAEFLAAYGDSNDDEIEALWETVNAAIVALGVTQSELEEGA